MAASDHLSPDQFPRMPMNQILRLRSIDHPDPGGHVGSILWVKRNEVAEDPNGDYAKLREDMRAHGQTYPIGVDPEHGLINGGHRVAIARQLGWKSMAYSPNIEDTGEEFSGLKLHDIPGGHR